jgi:uncharacterized protein DUF1905/bacteriocin resistance YdeI/OmpD-like protein
MAKVYKNPGPIEFTGEIRRNMDVSNSSAWVEFPYDLKETFGVGNLVPYKVTFDGRVHYQGSLAKMGGPSAMILLRKDVQAKLGKHPGDKVHVHVELDTTKREVQVGKDVERAYKAAGVWETFKKYPYSHQREYDMWIEDAKKAETRTRRIEKSIKELHKKQEQQS